MEKNVVDFELICDNWPKVMHIGLINPANRDLWLDFISLRMSKRANKCANSSRDW